MASKRPEAELAYGVYGGDRGGVARASEETEVAFGRLTAPCSGLAEPLAGLVADLGDAVAPYEENADEAG